ncbi:MAG: hypothetical protein AAF697_11365 [Pseudomonadota bacterium]
MQGLINIVESLTGTVRFVICAMVLVGFGITAFMTAGVSYVAPKVAEDFGERAERMGERAIVAAQEESRARELAQDGWGYEAPGSGAGSSTHGRGRSSDRAGGWGDDTE